MSIIECNDVKNKLLKRKNWILSTAGAGAFKEAKMICNALKDNTYELLKFTNPKSYPQMLIRFKNGSVHLMHLSNGYGYGKTISAELSGFCTIRYTLPHKLAQEWKKQNTHIEYPGYAKYAAKQNKIRNLRNKIAYSAEQEPEGMDAVIADAYNIRYND